MCFPKCTKCLTDPIPLFDKQGTLHEDENPNSISSQIIIPDDIHEHIDSVYLNFDLEEGILGFFYETSHKIFFVWTSPEAHDICEYYASLLY